MAGITRIKFTVFYENETETEATMDQRDQVAFEKVHKIGWGTDRWQEMLTQASRWAAWHALCRTGVLNRVETPFATWDLTVISVEPEDEEEVDPTNPEAISGE